MLKKLSVLAVCLFVLSGCGSSAGGGAQPSSDGASSPSQEVTASPEVTEVTQVLTVSDQATCQTLVGSDGGLVVKSGLFLGGLTELSDSNAAQAQGIADELDAAAQTASDKLKSLLIVMEEPLKAYIAANTTGKGYTTDVSRFKVAANEAVDICSKLVGSAAGAASEPVTVPTTGDYAADLAALNQVPDNVESYKAFMKTALCDSDLNDRLRSFLREVRVTVGSPPQAERANVARLNVAYLCPERADDLEQTLKELAAE